MSSSTDLLLSGVVDFPPHESPEEILSWMLNGQGGIICVPLYYLKYEQPKEHDAWLLQSLVATLNRFFAIGHKLMSFVGLDLRAWRHHVFKPQRIFAPLDVPSRTREQWCRMIDAACRIWREFLEWMGVLCRAAAAKGMSALEPVRIAPAMRSLIVLADNRVGAVVMRNPTGEGVRTFNIRPSCRKAWQIVRCLVERCDEQGTCSLPEKYGSYFVCDAKGLNADLPQFYRHILPTGQPGSYRLTWETKPELRRD